MSDRLKPELNTHALKSDALESEVYEASELLRAYRKEFDNRDPFIL